MNCNIWPIYLCHDNIMDYISVYQINISIKPYCNPPKYTFWKRYIGIIKRLVAVNWTPNNKNWKLLERRNYTWEHLLYLIHKVNQRIKLSTDNTQIRVVQFCMSKNSYLNLWGLDRKTILFHSLIKILYWVDSTELIWRRSRLTKLKIYQNSNGYISINLWLNLSVVGAFLRYCKRLKIDLEQLE